MPPSVVGTTEQIPVPLTTSSTWSSNADLALFELYAGALLSESPNEDIPTVTDDLSVAEPLPLTNDAAQDAARIHANLLSQGNRIQLPDVLNAATARSADATLVATDGHFERIDDLLVHNPHEEQ